MAEFFTISRNSLGSKHSNAIAYENFPSDSSLHKIHIHK